MEVAFLFGMFWLIMGLIFASTAIKIHGIAPNYRFDINMASLLALLSFGCAGFFFWAFN